MPVTDEDIEAGLAATITTGLTYLAGDARAYAGELEALEAQAAIPAPCVRFFLGDHRPERVDTESIMGPQRIGCYAIAANYDETGGARAGEYGAHRICRDLIALLQGSSLGIPDLPPLEYAGKRPARVTPDRTVYLVEFGTFTEIPR